MNYPVPENEEQRLLEQRRLNILGGGPSRELEAVTQLAAELFGFPMAAISILEKDRQIFKTKHGIDIDHTEREYAFCNYTLQEGDLFHVEDALEDANFALNPYVIGHPGIRSYIGYPLSVDGVHALGAFCILDKKPRQFASAEQRRFRDLARVVEGLLRSYDSTQRAESARKLAETRQKDLQRRSQLLEKITEVSGIGGWELQLGADAPVWTEQTRRIHEVAENYTPTLDEAINFYAPEARETIAETVREGMEQQRGWDLELPLITATGRKIWARTIGEPIVENNVVTGLIGTFQDITEKKNNEFRLVGSELEARTRRDELSVMLASMKSGVSVFDRDSKLQLWNDQYIQIFQKPPHEICKGVSFREILAAEKHRGEYEGDIDVEIKDLLDRLAAGQMVKKKFELASGRIISSVHAPMPGGGWVGTHDDITQEEMATRRIFHAANHDSLTGLANRMRFSDESGIALRSLDWERQRLAMMLIDLDGFKPVNDTHGHHVGDLLLQEVAQRLRTSVRPSDIVARLGGDEFAVLLRCPVQWRECIEDAAQRILQNLMAEMNIQNVPVKVGASIGIAVVEDKSDTLESTMKNADAALYRVKDNGKKGFFIYDAETHMAVTKRKMLETALREVVKKQDFQLYFQPLHSARNGERVGCEALIRWNSEEFPHQHPADFIPLAEELGLIVEVGDWVIRQGIKEASWWADPLSLAINLSSRQLGRDSVYETVSQSLLANRLPAWRLELEITEYTLLKNDPGTIEELRRLKDLGVKIVLDDFGTGYSSLTYLYQFPFDKIKIDRSFLSGFERSEQKTTIVKTISEMGSRLGIEVTAEGVENEEQLELLKSIGCDYIQGFYFGKPAPASQLGLVKQQAGHQESA